VRECGYKVVLTGEGADEVFGGYDLFKEAKVRRWLARSPKSTFRPRILERLYPYLKNSPAASGVFTQRFFGEGVDEIDRPWFAHLPRMTTTQRTWQFLHPDVQDRLRGWDARGALRATLPDGIDQWHPMGRDQYVEAHTLLSGYLLSSQGDRVAMAHSIEARYPFLDHRVIEFANRLPAKYKLRGLIEKRLLKQAMRGEIPESIRRRSKQPYRAPDCASFFHDGGMAVDYVDELMSEGSIADVGLFDHRAVSKLLAKCRAGRAIGFADNMAFIGVLSTMLLHEQYVRPVAGPRAWT
jgi:asparagine synthase (glutamine-hydrolysing)